MDSMGNAERVVSLVLSTALITGCIAQSTAEPTPITSPVPSGAKTPEPENTPLPYGTQIRTTDTLTPSPSDVAKTNLNPNYTSQPIDLSADVFVVGAGGETSTKFGEPKISQKGWTQAQIDKARAQAGEIHAGGQLFIQIGEGKIVYQRATGLRADGVDYATLPDNEVPFLVTLSTLPSAITLADGHYTFLADQSKLGLAVYINEATGKLYTVKTQFELKPSYLPAGAAVVQYQEGAVGGGIQVLLLDGEGNVQFGPNLEFQGMSAEVPTSTDTNEPPTKTSTVTTAPTITVTPSPLVPPEGTPVVTGAAGTTVVATDGATPGATGLPTGEATMDPAEFAAKKAEALKMVDTSLESLADFQKLPVLDDKNDYDTGKVQEMERWLAANVLPKVKVELPKTFRIACNDATQFCWMSYDKTNEASVVDYRAVGAFFVVRDGVKMLRIGVEYGGSGQLIHYNFEDPKWWTNPVNMQGLIDAFNRTTRAMYPIVSYGSSTVTLKTELYNQKVAADRAKSDPDFFTNWVNNRKLDDGADRTVFQVAGFVK